MTDKEHPIDRPEMAFAYAFVALVSFIAGGAIIGLICWASH